MKKLLQLSFLLLACTGSAFAQTFEVGGTFPHYAGKYVFFEKFVKGQPVKSDSALINKKGKFKMTATVEAANFHRLAVDANSFVLLIPQAGEKITVSSNEKPIQKAYTVSGSPESSIIAGFVAEEQSIQVERNELMTSFNAAQAAGAADKVKEIQASLTNNNKRYRDLVIKTVNENSNSVASLVALGKLQINQDFDSFKKVYEGLKSRYPDSEYVGQLESLVTKESARRESEAKEGAATAVGSEAKAIKLPSPDGKEIALSDLRGKYVLIDFWASWCRPCRAENPNVVRLYKKYKDAGFEVYSVSLDNNKDRWVKAIEQDGLIWPSHVSDLKGWSCAPAKEYGVRGIPFTVLIDKDGNIIAKNLRGAALENKLAELFSF